MAGDIYLKNPNLKAAAVNVNFTADQISEYLKCQKDPVYFIESYMKIISLDEGLIPFKLWKFQQKMIQTFHKNRFTICKLPRQSGKCFSEEGYITIRNKKTGEEKKLKIGDFYKSVSDLTG